MEVVKVNVNRAGGAGQELERMQTSEHCLFQKQKPFKLLNEGKKIILKSKHCLLLS